MQHHHDPPVGHGGTPDRAGGGRRTLGRVGRLAVASGAVAGLTVVLVGAAGATTTTPSGERPGPARTGRPPGGGKPPTAVGKVTSVGTGTFTLETRGKTTIIVDVSAGTTFRDPKVTSPSIADVAVGDRVGVIGFRTSDTVDATTVMVGMPGPGGPRGAPPKGGGSTPGAPLAA